MQVHDLEEGDLFKERSDEDYVWEFESLETDGDNAVVRRVLMRVGSKWRQTPYLDRYNEHMNAYAEVLLINP